MATYFKDPGSTLDWQFNWASWLENGEAVTGSTFVADSGITIASNSFTATTATVWLAGGTAGTKYKVTNSVTTNQGRSDERSITIWASTR